jgi:mRNA interferase RelE/StbE
MTNLPQNWDLKIDPSVLKEFAKIPKKYVLALNFAIRNLPSDPYLGDIQKLKGEDEAWRRRVGSYRIFYKIKITEKVILVYKVERRGSNTY